MECNFSSDMLPFKKVITDRELFQASPNLRFFLYFLFS